MADVLGGDRYAGQMSFISLSGVLHVARRYNTDVPDACQTPARSGYFESEASAFLTLEQPQLR